MDYYNMLGVNKQASPEDIKKAYKKLAMQHHPDRGGDQTTFQQINEAYETLRDPAKRKRYDSPQSKINMNSQNFEDVFSEFFGQRRPQQRRNRDIKIALDLTLEDVAVGKDVLAGYRLYSGQETTATLRIHPGINHGEVIRYSGLGDNSIPSMPKGDLLIQCRVARHARFERDRHHLKTKLNINVFELVLGSTYVIDNLTGGQIRVNIPKSTNPGTILSIAGHGLLDPRTNRVGNLYVELKGTVPKLNKEQLEKVKQINDELSTRT